MGEKQNNKDRLNKNRAKSMEQVNNKSGNSKIKNNKISGEHVKHMENGSSNKNNEIRNNNEERNGKRAVQKEKKKKGKVGKFFARFFLVVLILLLVGGSIFAYKVHKNGGGLSGLTATILGTNQEVVKNLPPVYVVLLGESGGMTDTIMLVKYNPKNQTASLLSIPRDTFIGTSKDTATPYDKINALCQSIYPERTVQKVSEITGIPVTNYILVDTEGLKQLVDLIGGVWFDVPMDMHYTDKNQDLYIRLTKGYQLLDGDKAEQLVRFRHNSDGTTYPTDYGMQDFGRTKTQREFLKAVAKQTLKPQNIFKVGQLMNLAYTYVKTNMTMTEFKDYIPSIVDYNSDNLNTDMLPGTSELCNDYWFVIQDKAKSKEVVSKLFSDDTDSNSDIDGDAVDTSAPAQTEQLVGEGIKVQILNGTSNTNTLTNLKNKLIENGYTVAKTGTTSKASKTTITNNTNKDDKTSNDLQTIVGLGELDTGTSNSSNSDFTIVIGEDY